MAEALQIEHGRPYPPPAAPEPVWEGLAAVLAAVGLQIALPSRLTFGPNWLIPGLEGLLALGLLFASPRVLEREHPRRRLVALALIAFVSFANIYSLVELSRFLIHHEVTKGRELIFAGMLIWLTNFLIFALWYWEMDRGGPGKRATGQDGPPDFLFPQMADDRVHPPGWRPHFIDYLYVSLTNATAFSPTDTMPLTHTAKSVMGVQSIVSLVTIGLIVARAVNVL